MFKTLVAMVLSLALTQGIKLDPDTRMFVDDYGRTVIFHGVNAVVKLPPYIPITDRFDPAMSISAQDIAYMTEWGFNFIRLGVMWEAVETSPGVYNTTYLNLVNDLVNKLGQNGIWTLIDNHQDVFARKICGEGVPDFYAANLTDTCGGLLGPLLQSLGLCTPFSDFNYTYQDGVPLLSDCQSRDFALYYTTPEAADAFQRIYENIYSYQDRLSAFWDTISAFFVNNSYVVGYDIINEPLSANMVTQPWKAIPGMTDLLSLQPLYQNMNITIRKNDQEKVIFFEPVQGDLLPLLDGMIFPVGFTETPGGSEYNDRQILNDHSYCCQAGLDICKYGEPTENYTDICREFNFARVVTRSIDAQNLNTGLIISEFGACFNTLNCSNEIKSVADACDYSLVGWAYWQYKSFGDFTTSGNTGSFSQEGLFDQFSQNQTIKIKALARTYVQYYQGTPLSIAFDSTTGNFKTTFTYNNTITQPSVIFASAEYYYPNGLTLIVQTNTFNLTYTYSSTNYLTVPLNFPTSQNVTFIITPNLPSINFTE
jgi:endoglycosylceramidase